MDAMNGIKEKIEELRKIFTPHSKDDDRYMRIIELGRSLATYPVALKIPKLQVAGCQSILYLSSSFRDGRIYFEAHSDALISAGLAALLISIYSGETPEAVLKTPPTFLTDFGIIGSLTPSRSNGLANIHLRMKRDALNFLVERAKSLDFNAATL